MISADYTYMMKRFTIALLTLVFIGQGCAPASIQRSEEGLGILQGNQETGSTMGEIAPDFALRDFDGDIKRLSDYRGTPVFIDFWAAWCPFCINELPEIEAVHKEFGDQIKVLGIHRTSTESKDIGADFATERGVTYPLLQDEKGDVYKAYTGGRPFMPVAVFIDGEGVITDIFFGPKSKAQIEAALQNVLGM